MNSTQLPPKTVYDNRGTEKLCLESEARSADPEASGGCAQYRQTGNEGTALLMYVEENITISTPPVYSLARVGTPSVTVIGGGVLAAACGCGMDIATR